MELMKRDGLLILDGDDTLWAVEPLYDGSLEAAERIVSEAGLDGQAWRARQRDLDLRNVATLGMSPERFPLSSKQALEDVARKHGVTPPESLVQAVVDAAKAVFSTVAPLVPGVDETLRRLGTRYHLALLTKGAEDVQNRRIDDSGLRGHFSVISIVREKGERDFRLVAENFDAPPDHTWSIGNSLVSDINPALRCGFNAIWIDAHVWEHERRETEPARSHLITLGRFDELPEILLAADRAI